MIQSDSSQENQIKLGRIDAKAIARQLKILQICGISLIAIGAINLVFFENIEIIGQGKFLDLLIMVGIGTIFIVSTRKSQIRNRKGQFIDWKKDSLVMRLKGEEIEREVIYTSISSVDIDLDVIRIGFNDNTKTNLDISDFQKYENRILIKQNFETLKRNLNRP